MGGRGCSTTRTGGMAGMWWRVRGIRCITRAIRCTSRGLRRAERLRPRVGLCPIGAYSPVRSRVVHTSPEEAVRWFVELGAERMVPMHYGTFRLGREPMDEPVQRLMAEAARLR